MEIDLQDRIDELERRLSQAESRLRTLETRQPPGQSTLSNTKGQTKRVRLSDDGETVEVE